MLNSLGINHNQREERMAEIPYGSLGKKSNTDFYVVIFTLIICFAAGLSEVHLFGDSATYAMMVNSMVHDGDLVWGPEDFQRVDSDPDMMALRGLILKKTGDHYEYSKPAFYPILAFPLYLIFGQQALLILNGLLMAAIILLGYFHLRQFAEALESLAFVLAVVCFSILWFYTIIAMADVLQFFLMALSYFLAARRKGLCAMIPMAIIIAEKAPNILFALPLLLLPLLEGQWRESLKRSAVLILCLFICFLILFLVTGSAIPYLNERVYFPDLPPFSGEPEPDTYIDLSGESGIQRILANLTSLNINVLSANTLYLFIGQHFGIFLYYLPLLAMLMLPGDWRLRSMLITMALLQALFFFLLWPQLWQGGACIGYRYFYVYIAFLFTITSLEKLKRTFPVLLLAAVFVAPISFNSLHYALTYQGHNRDFAQTGIWKYFPYEISISKNLPHRMRLNRVNQAPGMFYSDDKNVYQQETNGFWTRGHSRSVFYMVSSSPEIILTFNSILPRGKLSITQGNNVFNQAFSEGNQSVELEFTADSPIFSLNGEDWYRVELEYDQGARPSEISDSTDIRNLGIFVNIDK